MKKKIIDFNSKEFKDLQKKWYDKVAKSGFTDIELNKKAANQFYETSENPDNWRTKVYRDSKLEYYQMARDFLNYYEFATELDKVIWEYHTEGISMENIVKTLKKVGIKTNRDSIWRKIKQYRKEMLGYDIT